MYPIVARFASRGSTSWILTVVSEGKLEKRRCSFVSTVSRFYGKITQDEKSMEGSVIFSRLPEKERNYFVGREDRYNGIIVDSTKENCHNFDQCLEESMKRWKSNKKSTIWFCVDLKNADWIPSLAKEGFKFHHASEGFAMMYRWLPTEIESNIPPYAHTNLGVGGFVFNDETGEILVVKDKRSVLGGPPRWKLPGGFADPGEEIPDAVIREVQEETGIQTEFEGLLGFRHAHGYSFGCSDIYIVARLKPLTREIRKCDREIADCTWMKFEDYAKDPNIVQNNRILAQALSEYLKNRISLKLIEGENPRTKGRVSIYLLPPTCNSDIQQTDDKL